MKPTRKQKKTMLQRSEEKHLKLNEMKTPIYYFELENETITIKMERKSREELRHFKEVLNAKKVYVNLRGTN